jgi:hypothetical protein
MRQISTLLAKCKLCVSVTADVKSRSYPCTGLDRARGLQQVEACRISRQTKV